MDFVLFPLESMYCSVVSHKINALIWEEGDKSGRREKRPKKVGRREKWPKKLGRWEI